eukprot:PhF_6_TR4429/c0_g1_i3/m.5996/K00826/E2.6.1.42, ilvE; branched-chain amino acid aminotransferase
MRLSVPHSVFQFLKKDVRRAYVVGVDITTKSYFSIASNAESVERHVHLDQQESASPSPPPCCYEVFQVLHDKPMFLTSHLDRLQVSYVTEYPSYQQIDVRDIARDIVKRVIAANPATATTRQNMKLLLWDDILVGYYIDSTFPSEELYTSQGVHFEFLDNALRQNPNAKVWGQGMEDIRSRATALQQQTKCYEVLLVHPGDDVVTEGSRSNYILVTRSGAVVTSPESVILQGVTRRYVLKCCEALGIPVVEHLITRGEIESKQLKLAPQRRNEDETICAIAMLGNSVGVLPVTRVGMTMFQESCGNEVLIKLREAYA